MGLVTVGLIQPNVRLQIFKGEDDEFKNPVTKDVHRWDMGINYIIDGHNARISAVYTYSDDEEVRFAGAEGRELLHMFTLGTQVQF